MRHIKYWLNIIFGVPIYFLLLVILGQKTVFKNAVVEVKNTIYSCKRLYGKQ